MRSSFHSPYWNAPHFRPMHRFELEDLKRRQRNELERQWMEEERQRKEAALNAKSTTTRS